MKKIIKKILKKLKIKIPVYIPVLFGDMLANKNILITGGSSGIGYSIALSCLKNGANVVITGRDFLKLEKAKLELEKTIRSSNTIDIFQWDLNNFKSIKENIGKIKNFFQSKKIDILINNAGILKGSNHGSTSIEDFDEVIDINLKSYYFLSQEFANYLVKEKIKGNILNVSSSSGYRPSISPYMISKNSVISLTRGLAKKLIKNDIVVNGIAPGPTTTEMLKLSNNNMNNEVSPSRRYLNPNEVANLAVFLISSCGRMIVGETIFITGGSGTLTFDDINY